MPRRSSGGSRAAMKNPPAPVKPAQPPAPMQQNKGSVLGGIGGAVADGMAWGTGTAIAHRAVDAVMGPRTVQHEHISNSAPTAQTSGSNDNNMDMCNLQSKAFQDCINENGSDISKCQFYLDMLNECRRGGSEMLRA